MQKCKKSEASKITYLESDFFENAKFIIMVHIHNLPAF